MSHAFVPFASDSVALTFDAILTSEGVGPGSLEQASSQRKFFNETRRKKKVGYSYISRLIFHFHETSSFPPKGALSPR